MRAALGPAAAPAIDLEAHPAAAWLPPPAAYSYELMKLDIWKEGQRVPIWRGAGGTHAPVFNAMTPQTPAPDCGTELEAGIGIGEEHDP